jgi:membrane protein
VSAYFDTLKQAFKDFNKDHMTSVAAALAYYAFLAIPATLLVAVGLFSLFAGPGAINTVIDKLGNVIPKEALDLVEQSLTNMTQHRGTGLTVLLIGLLLALWSLTGAMQNVMWALNIAYDREESRSFVQKRLAALAMIGFGLLGFALAFGVLVLGPHLATWIGDATGSESVVKTIWYIAEWPLLLAGLLLSFAGVMYFGPDVEQRKWSFFTFGALFAIVVWIVASGLFSFYVSKFGGYNKAWGALAGVVVMLTWLWISGCALLLGGEINAQRDRSRPAAG